MSCHVVGTKDAEVLVSFGEVGPNLSELELHSELRRPLFMPSFSLSLVSIEIQALIPCLGRILSLVINTAKMESNESMPLAADGMLTDIMTRPLGYFLTTIILLAVSYAVAGSKSGIKNYPLVNANPKGSLLGRLASRVSLTNCT